jgi:hypothetical protein
MWFSLKRTAEGHWGEEATVYPDGKGFKVTLQLTEKIEPGTWGIASKYMRRYARHSHWALTDMTRQHGRAVFHIEYSPPKPKRVWRGRMKRGRAHRPDAQKTEG